MIDNQQLYEKAIKLFEVGQIKEATQTLVAIYNEGEHKKEIMQLFTDNLNDEQMLQTNYKTNYNPCERQ